MSVKFKPTHSSPTLREVPVHSHDRTLIAKLGFADKDKSNLRHDLACQFFCEEENAAGLATYLTGEPHSGARCAAEFHLTKGVDRFKTSVGFLDLVIHCQRSGLYGQARIVGEVKIEPVGVGDLLRQINLYRGHVITPFPSADDEWDLGESYVSWVAIVDYDVTEKDVEMLRRSRVRVVRLGPAFEQWVKAQGGKKADIKTF